MSEWVSYWTCVSALDRMVRRYEAVSLGLKVDGTIRYSPGISAISSITSRAFTYVLLCPTGAFFLKKESGNLPVCDLYCNTNNPFMELNTINGKISGEQQRCMTDKIWLTSLVTLKENKHIVNLRSFQQLLIKNVHKNLQRVKFASNTEKPIWRFWTRRLFLLSGFCIRDTSMVLSLSLEEHSLSSLSTLTRYCGLVQKLSRRTNIQVISKNNPFAFCSRLTCLERCWSTDVIHASSSIDSCNPSALIAGAFPVAGRVSIQEVRTQAADVEVYVEPAEIL